MHILIGLAALVIWFIGIIRIGVSWKVFGIVGDKHDTKR